MRTEILRLHRRISATIIYVTHDQVEAMTMSTRLAVMDAGAAVQIDPPRVIFDAPENKTVATFIGTPAMNIVPGGIVQDGDGLAIDLFGRRIAVPADRAQALGARRQVEIGMRPQALRLVAPEGDAIRGTVLLREPLGLEDEFLVQIDDATVKVVTSQGRRFAEDSAVGLEIDPRAALPVRPRDRTHAVLRPCWQPGRQRRLSVPEVIGSGLCSRSHAPSGSAGPARPGRPCGAAGGCRPRPRWSADAWSSPRPARGSACRLTTLPGAAHQALEQR